MLRAFGHPVAMCYDMLGIKSELVRMHKCCIKNLAIFKFGPTTPNMLQHAATRFNMVAKRAQHASPNIVAVCCVGRGLTMVKIFMQHLRMLHDVVVVLPGSCNNVVPRHAL